MRSAYNAKAPKRPVNLSLNEDLIAQARDVTNNLSEVVESLLADSVAKERGKLGKVVHSLAEQGQQIIDALDELITHAHG